MELSLSGKGVVVTGASKGIGKSISNAFAKEGANLAICARGDADLDTAHQELCDSDIKVHAETCDVADKEALQQFLENARHALGSIDVLVNNASVQMLGDDDNAWTSNFEVDVMAVSRAIKIVAPWMKSGGGGSIVNISSLAALFAYPSPPYSATKAAMISLSKSYSLSLAKDGIRVRISTLSRTLSVNSEGPSDRAPYASDQASEPSCSIFGSSRR